MSPTPEGALGVEGRTWTLKHSTPYLEASPNHKVKSQHDKPKSRGNFIYCAHFEYFESHNTIQRRDEEQQRSAYVSRGAYGRGGSMPTREPCVRRRDWVQPRAPPHISPEPEDSAPTLRTFAHQTAARAAPCPRSEATRSPTVTTAVNL